MADEIAALESGRNLKEVIRYVLGVAVGILVLVLLFGRQNELVAAWHQLSHVSAGWVVGAAVAEAASLWVFAFLQRTALGLAGATIPMPGLFLLTMANDAISNTVPGEPAVSSAFRYRYYRRRGADGAAAGWTIFTILIAQAIGMSLLLLIGVMIALVGSPGGRNARAAVVGLVIVAAAGAVLVRRDLVLRLAESAVRGIRRVTGHPRGSIGVVEGSLAVILAAYGADRTSALSVALVFRAVSFWLAIAIGWISVGVIFRQGRKLNSLRR